MADRNVDFDAWVASRSAALTRFAYLLTGHAQEAETALRTALVTSCLSWSRLRRADDPEASVRRMVVGAHLSRTRGVRHPKRSAYVVRDGRLVPNATTTGDLTSAAWELCAALPPHQRAAVVLRCYENMTFPQIASFLDCSHTAVREYVQRTFASLRDLVRRGLTDDQAEAALRDALAEHADDPDDNVDHATLARTGRRRRHRQAVAAAAVVVVTVAAVLAVAHRPVAEPLALEESGAPAAGWRAESYHGFQLWVPSSWGWGGAPRRVEPGVVTCGSGAGSRSSLAADLRYSAARAFPGYVGRPAGRGRTCPAAAAAKAHVWFDSPLDPGWGRAQTTVRVQGHPSFNITVAGSNLAERRMILRSLEPVTDDANGCPRDEAGTREVESQVQTELDAASVRTLSLCLYSGGTASGQLYYSTRLEGWDAREAVSRIESAPAPVAADVCLVSRSRTEIVLVAVTPTGPVALDVFAASCSDGPVRYVTGPGVHVITSASARMWAVDGLSFYAGVASTDGS